MNAGKLMRVDDPAALKQSMPGEIIEVVCEPVRRAFALLRNHRAVREVQMFGDRLHVAVDDARRDMPVVECALSGSGVSVHSRRRIAPSLENVFISLLTHPKTVAP
jgi:ABC-2 type transport system ATP-binding protein